MQDVEGSWLAKMGLPLGSALLVRPDGHVAWRHVGPRGPAGAEEALACLTEAVASLFYRPDLL